jgi:hypothetical protein
VNPSRRSSAISEDKRTGISGEDAAHNHDGKTERQDRPPKRDVVEAD